MTESTRYFSEFGGVGDVFTNNAQAFINMSNWINSRKGNCNIIFEQGTYQYTPNFTNLYEWRELIKLTNCKNIMFEGMNSCIKLSMPSNITVHTQPFNQEGCFQLTSCEKISFRNLCIMSDPILYQYPPVGTTLLESNCNGVTVTSCNDLYFEDVNFGYWGLNGIYCNPKASSSYRKANSNIRLYNCKFESCFRSGIHLKNVGNVFISDCTFNNCGVQDRFSAIHSFPLGYVDSTTGLTINEYNDNINITDCVFTNNGIHTITLGNTVNAIISNSLITENYDTCEPFLLTGKLENININNLKITGRNTLMRLRGLTDDISSLVIRSNKFLSKACTNTQYAIYMRGNTSYKQEYTFLLNEFSGTGGIYSKDLTATIYSNKIVAKKLESINNDCFNIRLDNIYSIFYQNTITVENTISWTTDKEFYINNTDFVGNKLLGQANAIMYIPSTYYLDITSPKEPLSNNVGYNYFSTYFYYKGESDELNIYDYNFAKLNLGRYWVYNGGYSKTLQPTSSLSIQNLYDIVYDFTVYDDLTLNNKNFYTFYMFDHTKTDWVGFNQKRVKTNLANANLIKSKLTSTQNGLVIDWINGAEIKKLLYDNNKLYDMMGNEVV
jgi:hypothetical protein